jgi:hypothetical protein
MLQFSEIIISFFTLTLLLILAIFLGKLIEVTTRENKNGKTIGLFWQLLVGTFLLISFYAIFSTKGISIFLIVPVLLFLFVRAKLQVVNPIADTRLHLLFFVCSILINFTFYFWALYSFESETVTFVSGDFNIYYRIAQRLNDYGIESLNLDPIYSAQYASPYHYGDIWMYALVSKFISSNPSVIYLIAFSHFSIIFINGIFSYAYSRYSGVLSNNKGFLFLLLFAGLFTGFNIFFPNFIIPSAEPYTFSTMIYPKVLVPSCFLVGLLILAKEKNWLAFVLLAMVGGLSFINALPSIFMSVFLLLTINLVKKQIKPKQLFILTLCYVGITVVFIVFLYKILPSIMGLDIQETTGVEMKGVNDIKVYLTTAFKIFVGGGFQLFVLFPFFIIFFIGLGIRGKIPRLKQIFFNLDNDILFMTFVVLSGLTCWALLHPFTPDSVQFYTNILAPIYAIFISYLTVNVIFVWKNNLLSVITISCLLVCILVNRSDPFFTIKYEKKEWNMLKTFVTKSDVGTNFINLQPQNHFNSFFDKNTVYFMPILYLNYLWPNYHNFSLNAPFIPVNEKSPYADAERVEINQAPFTIYYKRKNNEQIGDMSFITNSFIKDAKVGYISISKDTMLPHYLRNLVKDSITLEKANFVVYRIK